MSYGVYNLFGLRSSRWFKTSRNGAEPFLEAMVGFDTKGTIDN